MTYEAWRISYQSADAAARAAYEMYLSAAFKLQGAEKDRDEWKATAMNQNDEKASLLSRLQARDEAFSTMLGRAVAAEHEAGELSLRLQAYEKWFSDNAVVLAAHNIGGYKFVDTTGNWEVVATAVLGKRAEALVAATKELLASSPGPVDFDAAQNLCNCGVAIGERHKEECATVARFVELGLIETTLVERQEIKS